ncbi:protein CHUP1, chloroplastic [Cornus florida]|uniref:protein CHUP1, chloroplastic n=1 Tax=Cornus florida TaxID=4283 RepID=UPI00289684DA|nr:protein CHUP1, chloroplastic [Cornus florida]
MESTKTKVELMKPVILKAGIPIAISVAGFILARIKSKKSSLLRASTVETTQNNSHEEFRVDESIHSFDSSSSLPCMEVEKPVVINTHYEGDSQSQDRHEEELLGLRRRIEEFQERELKLEMKFLQYCDLKDQESVLMELGYMFTLEIARVESFTKEISLMEEENRRLEDLAGEYMKVLEQLEFSGWENGLLHRKVKNLLRKLKERSRAVREKNTQIEEREAQILANQKELERRANLIKELEDENRELKLNLDQLQQEKKELVDSLKMAEKSASSKIEAEGMIMEEYNHIVNELEQVQKDRAAEVKELIYLRWCNACLRHELRRRNQENQGQAEEKKQLEVEVGGRGEIGDLELEHELDASMLGQGESRIAIVAGSQSHSKRRKLIEKLKRWVEGNERIKQKSDEKHGIKCFGGHSVSDGAEEWHLHARKS